MNLSARFRALRKASGLTIRELADRVKTDGRGPVAFSYIHQLESNDEVNPSWRTIERVAGAYGMTPQELVAEEDGFERACSKLNERNKRTNEELLALRAYESVAAIADMWRLMPVQDSVEMSETGWKIARGQAFLRAFHHFQTNGGIYAVRQFRNTPDRVPLPAVFESEEAS